jgi:hypothetical protein
LVKISKTAAAAIGLAAALAGALPASAATISATATISPALTATLTSGGTQTLDFTPFDTALGTLTSVIVTESIDAAGSINFGGTSVTGVVLAAEGGSLTISEPGILANIMNETLSVSGACAAAPPGSCNGTGGTIKGAGFSPLSATLTDGGTLANFTDAATANLLLDASILTKAGAGTGTATSANITYAGTVTALYTYTPVTDAPEPASLGIFAFGTMVLAWRRAAGRTRG